MVLEQERVYVGDRLVELLNAWGIEYVFSSPGSDWPPLWEALARARALDQPAPQLFTCRHEQLAVCLAMGYYRSSGRLPVVVLHTGVGALHTAMVLRAAQHERVPMLVLVGEPTSFGEGPELDIGPQWLRTLTDVGGPDRLVAPYVKWAGTAPNASTLAAVLEHAADVALRPPGGPAFVSLPIELMVGRESFPLPTRPLVQPTLSWPDPSAVERAAAALLRAEHPLLVTETVGREPGAVPHLVAIAEQIGAAVVEAMTPAYLNFPRTHPLHQGFSALPLIAEADVVLLAGCTVPWHPASRWPKPGATAIAVDDDPTQGLLPMAGYRADLRLGGSVNVTLQQISAAIGRMAATLDETDRRRIAERSASLSARHRETRTQWDHDAQGAAQLRPIDTRWLAHALFQQLPENAILVEETTTDKQAFLRHAPRSQPATYHVRSTGGLGVMLGVAQGVKLASPDQLVVAVIGDGAFHYSPALANFGFAHQYGHPLLVILADNGAYVSMRSGHDRLYPEGWAVRTGVHPGTEIEPRPDYPALARAYGGYAELVEDPADLPGALTRALARVTDGQWAFLDVITSAEDTRAGR